MKSAIQIHYSKNSTNRYLSINHPSKCFSLFKSINENIPPSLFSGWEGFWNIKKLWFQDYGECHQVIKPTRKEM